MNFLKTKIVIQNVEEKMWEACKKMREIIDFFKEILMIGPAEKMPVGLCAFEAPPKRAARNAKPKRNREMRLSELMDK